MLLRHLLESLEEEAYEPILLIPMPGVSDGHWILDRFARQLGVEDPAEDPSKLLGQVYDGLQNPLQTLADQHGFFLPRGQDVPGLNQEKKWPFEPVAKRGARVQAGDVIGTTDEGRFKHKILVPFDEVGQSELSWIAEGSHTVSEPIARIKRDDGSERELFMAQSWPVRLK